MIFVQEGPDLGSNPGLPKGGLPLRYPAGNMEESPSIQDSDTLKCLMIPVHI